LDIRCISLIEPWASLVALGHKRIETRGWATAYRGPLGIHASRSTEFLKDGFPDKLCERANLFFRFGPEYPWPFGRILCVSDIRACVRTDLMTRPVEPREIALGDFSFTSERKRYGFVLSSPKLLAGGIPHRGSLSLWEPSIEAKIRIQDLLAGAGV
jgi:hypothetical protein